MTADEFRCKLLSYEGPVRSRGSLTYAAQYYTDRMRTNETDIEPCLRFADMLEDFLAYIKATQQGSREEAGVPEEQIPPEVTLWSESLADKLLPWVTSIRQELFGHSDLPFESLETAVEWIESAAQQACSLSDDQRLQAYGLKWEIEAKSQEYLALTGWQLLRVENERLMVYEKPDGTGFGDVHLRQPDPDEERAAAWSPLMTLDRMAEQMADVTGFSRSSLISYILAGRRPTIPPFAVSVHTLFHEWTGICRRQVTIDCYTRDMKYSDHREIFRQNRKALNMTKKKDISPEDQQFLEMVQRLGGPVSGKGSTAFWGMVCKECNRLAGKRKYQDSNGPRMRYVRLIKKLERYNMTMEPL